MQKLVTVARGVWALILWILAALTVVLVLGGALSAWLTVQWGIAQAISFPVVLGTILLALGVFSAWRLATPMVRVPAIVVSIAALGLVVFPAAPLLSSAPEGAHDNAGKRLSVVVYNSQDTLTAADFAALNSRFVPDLWVLPEAEEARVLTAIRGNATTTAEDFQVHTAVPTGTGTAATSVVVRSSISNYGRVEGPDTTFGTVTLAAPGVPTVVGTHTAPPMPRLLGRWREDVRAVLAPTENVIVAGDLNATLRHGPMQQRMLVDASQECGNYAGTWPANSIVRTPIDHVLVSPEIQVLNCETVRVGRGDHRALAVTLVLP